MKKEVNICLCGSEVLLGNGKTLHVIGSGMSLLDLVFQFPGMSQDLFKDGICEVWFYRGILLFRDCDEFMPFVVPRFSSGTCRFSSLRNAKRAISVYLSKKGGAK